ncbi:unnamed protein product [Mycena citricolor]|uniref:Mucoidy inhibitor A n=1 Tax=Mycena citricolor TaxID=2018698 RepID=A0AAD2HPT7_9AGAR|nr:unnamed protein product [Mycena citricolor]
MVTTTPPPFEPSVIKLRSISDSSIEGVSLYSSRAEVRRVFKLNVKLGHNQVVIEGLPNVLETASLRVEGRGDATIHDVTVAMENGEHKPTGSPKLTELYKHRERTTHALARVEKSLQSLEQYIGSMSVEHLPVANLDDVLTHYESTGARLDAKKSELTAELTQVDVDIASERASIAVPHESSRLRVSATIGVFAPKEGEVEIALVYAVQNATWTAFYDIRVDMSAKEKGAKLIYKAAVKQNSGESWDNVPLHLETSTPTFGVGIPELEPWNLFIPQPVPVRSMPLLGSSMSPRPVVAPMMRGRLLANSLPSASYDEAPPMLFSEAEVTSKGNVSATFRVPGSVNIPSDGHPHNFTIVELDFEAAMSWVSVPKKDAKTHLSARITNASEYTLLAGTASVYVDGSFISRSPVPPVSPQESFDCPLGLDPSIRITYYPVLKTQSQSGFYTKSATHVFSQRITIHNTKSVAIGRLKIIDQIPASQDSQIEVKLVNPALTLANDAKNTTKATQPQALSVSKNVVAQWHGVDEPNCDIETLGLDRKLNWICSVPAQSKINLSLDWEVTVSPASAQVLGW